MKMKYVDLCDIGMRRSENQDSVFAEAGDDWGLFVVADGMGGHSDGSRASGAITAALAAWIEEKADTLLQCQVADLCSELRSVLNEVNDRIYRETEEGVICGSTAVILLILGDSYVLVSAGDSRCYEVQRNFFQYSVRQMTIDEICGVPGKNYGKLLNAVGVRSPLRCSMTSGMLKKGQQFFLCSDGVYKFCTEEELLGMIKRSRKNSADGVREEIKKLVCRKGAGDNFSAILVTVG